jgi:hypothetical protein
MLCEVGRVAEAREKLAVEAGLGFDYPYDRTWVSAMVNVADAAATTGDAGAATVALERVAPFAGQIISLGGVRTLGAVARSLGRAATLLGEYDQAEQWFTSAHDMHRRLQAPYWAARGELDHADLCRVRRGEGDVERARELATSAAATAAEYGCAALSRRAANVLAAT